MMNTMQKAMVFVLMTLCVGSCAPQNPAKVNEAQGNINDKKEAVSTLESELQRKGDYQILVVKQSPERDILCVLGRTSGDLAVYRLSKPAKKLVLFARRNISKDFESDHPGNYIMISDDRGDRSFLLYIADNISKKILAYGVDYTIGGRIYMMKSGRDIKKDFGR